MRIRRIMAGALACLAAGAIAPAAHAADVHVGSATWRPQHSVAGMVRNSDVVVRGVVTSIADGPRLAPHTHPESWLPTRHVRVRVQATIKGHVGRTLVVRWIGGKDRDGKLFYFEGEPPFHVGQTARLYLNHLAGSRLFVTIGPDGVQPATGAVHVRKPSKPKAHSSAVQWWDANGWWIHTQAYVAYDGQWWLPAASSFASPTVSNTFWNICLPWLDYYTDARFDSVAYNSAKIRAWDGDYFGPNGLWAGTTIWGHGDYAEIAYNRWYIDNPAIVERNDWHPEYQTHQYAVQSAVCHELGHAMGLDHDLYSVMGSFYNYYWDQMPNATDVYLIQYMYDRYNYT